MPQLSICVRSTEQCGLVYQGNVSTGSGLRVAAAVGQSGVQNTEFKVGYCGGDYVRLQPKVLGRLKP